MKMTERKTKYQEWKSGDVISDGSCLFMIGYDNVSQKYRLVDLDKGIIMSDDYDFIQDLRKDNGDYNPITHAEVIYSE